MLSQEKYFGGTGLELVNLGDKVLYMDKDGVLYRVHVSKRFLAIEYADDLDDARKGIFDDVDLFDIPKDGGVDSIYDEVREAIEQYCT